MPWKPNLELRLWQTGCVQLFLPVHWSLVSRKKFFQAWTLFKGMKCLCAACGFSRDGWWDPVEGIPWSPQSAAQQFHLSCHWLQFITLRLCNGHSPPPPGSGAASGDGICKDEVTLDRTDFPWLAKAPSERIHRHSNNKWHLALSVMHQSHNAQFISYCLFLTKLQGAGKIQSGRSSVHNALIFAFFAPKHLLLGATGDRMLFYMDFWSDAGWLFSCF